MQNIQSQSWISQIITALCALGAGAAPAAAGQTPASPGLDFMVDGKWIQERMDRIRCRRTMGRVLFRCCPWKKIVRPSWSLSFKQSITCMTWSTFLVNLAHLFCTLLPACMTLSLVEHETLSAIKININMSLFYIPFLPLAQ